MPQIAWGDPVAPSPSSGLYGMELALRAEKELAVSAPAPGALAAAQQAAAVAARNEAMVERRADRERHHHSQIWTKGFHGGPHRKVIPHLYHIEHSLR